MNAGYGPPQQQGFGPPGGYGGPPRPPSGGGPLIPGAGGDANTTLPLVLNIVAAVLCGLGCITFGLSIIGIVFAVQGGNAKNSGDLMTARAKAKTSMVMFIITAVLGALMVLVSGVLFLVQR